jgi:hypothetical protein
MAESERNDLQAAHACCTVAQTEQWVSSMPELQLLYKHEEEQQARLQGIGAHFKMTSAFSSW